MNYWQLVQNEKKWSWSIVAILFLLAALFLRQLILFSLLSRMKQMPRDMRKEVQKHYERKAVIGWILFAASISLLTWLWVNPVLLVSYFPLLGWRLVAVLLFFMSLVNHTQAYAQAFLKLIEERLSSGKEA